MPTIIFTDDQGDLEILSQVRTVVPKVGEFFLIGELFSTPDLRDSAWKVVRIEHLEDSPDTVLVFMNRDAQPTRFDLSVAREDNTGWIILSQTRADRIRQAILDFEQALDPDFVQQEIGAQSRVFVVPDPQAAAGFIVVEESQGATAATQTIRLPRPPGLPL